MPTKKKPKARVAAVLSVSAASPRKVKKMASVKKARVRKRPAKKRAVKKRATKKLSPVRSLAALERRAAKALAKNRARAGELIEEIGRRKRRISNDFHTIGRALSRLSDEPLYSAAGYASFEALLKGEKLFSRTMAYKLMAVAEAYPRAGTRGLGFEKAYALLGYTAATPAPDLARTLAEGNPRIGNKRLKTISVRDLVDATRRVRAATGTSRRGSEPEREARRVARKVQRDLRKKGAKTANARARRLDGRWRVEIDLAVDEIGVLD